MPAPLIVILGPTAVGKTGLALTLAQAIQGEVVNADSRQIYRYLDVGTAKPTPEQRAAVPHHLLDVVDPDDNLTLAQYQKLAYDTIAAIHQRGHIPLLVGGTGQYLTAVVEGWTVPEVPPNLALRAELETFAADQGSAALHQRLQQLDPAAAAGIHHRNVRRVVRALEVCLETGQPISELQHKQPPPYAIQQHGLTLDRVELYERADRRIDDMVAQGFLAEVQTLLDKGYSRYLPSMSGLGYRELAAHLLDDLPLADAIASTKIATHDFIRRQYTWFRGHDSGILWHNINDMHSTTLITPVTDWLQKQV
ncbi:MAG TPA: tRNA (adenosine(37)-N6)-dimethylallyltransferase MiaA [Phototrophicaceae bacterium]|nr:tRNA (adenosine(37)-N6)-dimethylallyltransferase MiaA [Phototrophicaceae bacterium]